MTVKLLNEHHLKFLSLKGGCTGSSESTHIKMPHCWKSHDKALTYPHLPKRVEQVYSCMGFRYAKLFEAAKSMFKS